MLYEVITTGSGKTFTMAHVIARVNKPALVLAPNKTLAAQLYNEFKQLFPDNAVEYFVSYYDYYQPEAYIPSTDTYIQKDSSINDMIDKLRHSATRSVLSRRDIVVVASVSCVITSYSIHYTKLYDAIILHNLGYEIQLVTVNFGVMDSYLHAKETAKIIGFPHEVELMDRELIEKSVDMILKDGYPGNGRNNFV